MWIYVPETYCQSVLESEDSISASTWRAKTLEQFVMWREKPSLSRHWLKRWKQGGWIKRLFGRISEPSTARLGVESWIRSLAESRASLIPSPDFSAETTTSETSGRTPPELSPMPSPVESSWKMFQASLHITLNESGQTYEQWVTQQRRDYFRRLRSAQAINASDSSYWATATANRGTYSSEGYGSNLIEESKMWSTATADNTSSRSKRYAQGGEPLTMATGMWPTARGTDYKNGDQPISRRGHTPPQHLPAAAKMATGMWRTPSSSDGEGGVMEIREDADGHYKLRDDAAMWPTPTSSVAGEALNDEMDIYTLSSGNLRKRAKSGQTGSIGLPRVAMFWPTPQNRDYKSHDAYEDGTNLARKRAQGWTEDLNTKVVNWPTPTQRDHKDGTSADTVEENGLLGRAAPRSSRRSETTPPDGPVCSPKCRKLNPLFVELHMGVPMGFSSMKTGSIDSDRWETWWSLSRERLRSLLSAEGSDEHRLPSM
jgi:hypothetical protein